MCLIIDANTLSKVFKQADKNHQQFKPVLSWIFEGNGKIIIGGSKFKKELLENVQWFRPLLAQLAKANKVVSFHDESVDALADVISTKANDADFDDPHLVALIIKSKTKIVCSLDKRAYPHINNRALYPKKAKIPAIYSGKQNSNLLIDANICKCCNPKIILTKAQSKILQGSVHVMQ